MMLSYICLITIVITAILVCSKLINDFMTYKTSLPKSGDSNYTTCWSGMSQDKLNCCVGYSYNMNLEQIKKYYIDEGYTSGEIGGKYWDCKDSSDSSTWWSDCNGYWNSTWTGSCDHKPIEWR